MADGESLLRASGSSGDSLSGNIDRNAVNLPGRLDGRRTLRDVLGGMAADYRTDWSGSPRSVWGWSALIERGFLVPAGWTNESE
jgi:hypothetical protein